MQYIADLHIHSPFSRATSKESSLAGLAAWAQVKGIHLLGTGDFTHPGWFKQIREHLVPAEPGFFRLKDENIAATCRFVLTAEISSIYKRHGKVRKIHNLILAPDFAAVERLNARLAGIGNIESDGRPILGLDARHLLEIVLEGAPDGFLVPAHIWTPWFSLFGSKSGFDTVEECFGDLTGHIFALETGLSSDPAMNRTISALDRYALISNSDCHSPGKIGREANLFDTDFNFFAMRDALRNPAASGFQGTIEFFPEEGKYHFDGHRKCKICLEPAETMKRAGLCPVCGRPLTIGVAYRVLELADRPAPNFPAGAPAVYSLIPLAEVLGEILGQGAATKGVMAQYGRVIELFDSEFNLLLQVPPAEIAARYSPVLAEAVRRIRAGRVIRNPGYDGEFGTIKVFAPGEMAELAGQCALFAKRRPARPRPKPGPDCALFQKNTAGLKLPAAVEPAGLNPEQAAAVASEAENIIVAAGPGTGKTFTLVARLIRLLTVENPAPERMVVITFTNRAAEEVRVRLFKQLGSRAAAVFVGTFHAFCLHWLRAENPQLTVVGEEGRELLLRRLHPELPGRELKRLRAALTACFQEKSAGPAGGPAPVLPAVRDYLAELARLNCLDLEAIIPAFVERLAVDQDFGRQVSGRIEQLFIDEFQDLNEAQYQLVGLLARTARVFAIGDPDQAIYGFRGSSPAFFFRFIEEGRAQVLHLVRNYRSVPAIVTAATAVINNNPQPAAGTRGALIPHLEKRTGIERYAAPSPRAEAEFVVRRIEEFMGGISHFSINSGRSGAESGAAARSFRDFAVLYRLSRQAQVISEALAERGIPCQVVDAVSFFMKPELKGLYCWVKAAAGGADMADHLALLRQIKGVGAVTVRRLENELGFTGGDFFEQAGGLALTAKVMAGLAELKSALALFVDRSATGGLESALPAALGFLRIEAEAAAVQRFMDLAGAFGKDLAAFARHLENNARATVYDDRAEAVALMTMHAAKGLEFPVVFITGLEEGVMPYSLAGRDTDLEEERRLFYVALTRAREALVLTAAAGGNDQPAVSRFVAEIPSHLLEMAAAGPGRKRRKTAVQLKLF